MKAITLTQPWATLVAIGAKRIETRSWSTKYRGPLAIHAAKGWTVPAIKLAMHEPFKSVLEKACYPLPSRLPRGYVIAVCELIAVKKIDLKVSLRKTIGWEWQDLDSQTVYRFGLDDQEFAFGDYGPDRYAWMLHNVKRILPVPARGSLGLWNWEEQQSTVECQVAIPHA